jgi:Tfp pilus assembly protein PilX
VVHNKSVGGMKLLFILVIVLVLALLSFAVLKRKATESKSSGTLEHAQSSADMSKRCTGG